MMGDHSQTVRSMYDAFHRGDVASIVAKMSPDVVWDGWPDNRAQQAGVPWMQCHKGREGVAEFFKALGSLKFRSFQVRNLLAGGNQVAAEISVEFELTATGTVVRDDEVHLWTFDSSGEVVRFRHYLDTAKHIEAAKQAK